MIKKNIVLIIGQNKIPDNFKKSIKIYESHKNVDNIILVTYNYTKNIEFVKCNKNIKTILVPPIICELSIGYQKYLYDIGIKYINENYSIHKNIYILKTRMDVVINSNQLDFIFSNNYIIENNNLIFKYKIWVAWIHYTKPFYIEDVCFYSHISTMIKLSPYDGKLFEHQGHTHIRWFIILLIKYNLINTKKVFKEYSKMSSKFILDEITKNTLLKYRDIINNYFIIKTVENCINFRFWNDINFFKKKSNKLQDIINQDSLCNLKPAYSNDDFLSIKIK